MCPPAASATTQVVTLPLIPELYDPGFLDVLVPRREIAKHAATVEPVPTNPLMKALKATANHTFTTNGAPAFISTLSPTLDAFNELRPGIPGSHIFTLLEKSWAEDPLLTLRLIWNLRSIHHGKGEKELFYQAWGWLYKNHPRTALENLPILVEPICRTGKKGASSHGYWKDLLNILCLASLDQLGPLDHAPTYLAYPKMRRDPHWMRTPKYRREGPLPEEERLEKLAQVKALMNTLKADARVRRAEKSSLRHKVLVQKLRDPKFRALYIIVARLFANKLAADVQILNQIKASESKGERRALSFQLSLAAKWAPTPGCSHDRHTNIASAIAALLHHSQSLGTPRVSVTADKETAALDTHVLRLFYQRCVLTPLRKALELPEPLMSANRWAEIKYTRVASKCMQTNMEQFYMHDKKRFEKFLENVESGKKKISGATLMPHEILREAILARNLDQRQGSDIQKQIGEIKARGIEAQWKAMVNHLRGSGKLENSMAVCDVSGSMGSLFSVRGEGSKSVDPVLPAVAMSLVLAQLAQPPFSNGFITFSYQPQFVQLDPSLSLIGTVQSMVNSDWGMNTNLNAVFMDLLLPLAVQNKVKPEDMIKRLFIFSDMQFDNAQGRNGVFVHPGQPANSDWGTNHDFIARAYKDAGYEVPEIVYWNLALQRGTVPVTYDRKGVAIMSGFSPAMMKVFMGEEDNEIMEEGWEDVKADVEIVKEPEPEAFDPVSVMHRVLSRRSFLGLVVLD